MRRALPALLAAATVVAVALCGTPAQAETIGGEQLARPGRQVNLGPQAQPLPDIWAQAWILVDATDGTVLAAKNAHARRPPASTLKTLTALTLLPRLPLGQTYVGTERAARTEGAHAGIWPGQPYTVEQLFYGLMLPSGNDAAIALAQANGGVKKTVREMNEVAAALQATDTVAKTPNGLDRPGQVSSPYDLALIARAGLARPDFAAIVKTKKHPFPSKGGGTHPIYNQNRLLMGGYKGTVGVKTGFTTEAGRTFIGAARRKGHTLIFVGMGIKEHSATAAAKAMDWGFANRDKVTPIGTMATPIAAAAALTAAPSQTASAPPVDLATAGLEVPAAGDSMAPWWFWLLLVLAIIAAFVVWRAYRVRTGDRHRRFQRRPTPAGSFESR